jgi:hypothetical protein
MLGIAAEVAQKLNNRELDAPDVPPDGSDEDEDEEGAALSAGPCNEWKRTLRLAFCAYYPEIVKSRVKNAEVLLDIMPCFQPGPLVCVCSAKYTVVSILLHSLTSVLSATAGQLPQGGKRDHGHTELPQQR